MARAPNTPDNGENFVHHIVADPKNVPDVMMLYGYPGASSEEGHERLYLSADLSRYVEVPRTAILHREHAAKEQDPHGGVTLWVKKDAALINKMAPAQQAAQQALAYYFAGALQGGAAGAQAMGPGGPPQTIVEAACPASIACTAECTHVGPCLTHIVTCAATCHATCAATCAATCHVTCHATCVPHACTLATCGVTCIATCHVTCAATCVATCHATCAATCVATCHATCHATCIPVCTHATPCVRPTLNQPDCPFPSEICTHVAPCTQLPNCRLPEAAPAGMGAAGQVGCANFTRAASVQIACSAACPTRYYTCYDCGQTRLPIACSEVCPSRFNTCNYECITHAGGPCIVSVVVCPGQSPACPY